jgi:transcriptional regulator with XRE-family HTH domain
MPPDGTLGALMAEGRRRRHLTQAEVAAMVRTSVRTVSAIERNRTHPRPGVLARLCDALGIDRDEAFTRRSRS